MENKNIIIDLIDKQIRNVTDNYKFFDGFIRYIKKKKMK